jgi:hypothetical protein
VSPVAQIPEAERSDSLRPIAVLKFEPDYLTAHYGLKFEPDERDTSVAALVVTESGHQYMLLRHHDSPAPGTEILASEFSHDHEGDLREILSALELGDDVVTWRLRDEG